MWGGGEGGWGDNYLGGSVCMFPHENFKIGFLAFV